MIRLPEHIQSLKPYKPGKSIESVQRELGLTELIKLASNENPFGPSPKALARMAEHAANLHYYPNSGLDLRNALAERLKCTAENVVCAAGSESVLMAAMKAMLEPGAEMVSSRGTFVGFQVLAHASACRTHYCDLTPDFRFDVEAIAAAITPATRLVYVANPNNPSGTYLTAAEFEYLHSRVPDDVLLIMDEAYYEYSCAVVDDYPDSFAYRHDNVLTLRTFSKVYGLAGLRIGYGLGGPRVIEALHKVKLPFEPSTVAQSAALGAMDDDDFLQRTVTVNRDALEFFTRELKALGLEAPRSVANFVLLDRGTPENVAALYHEMLIRGVITRPLTGFGLPHCLRISTGTAEENARCMQVLKEAIGAIAP